MKQKHAVGKMATTAVSQRRRWCEFDPSHEDGPDVDEPHAFVPDRLPRMPLSARTAAVDGSGEAKASLANLPMVLQQELEGHVLDMVMPWQRIRRPIWSGERPMLSCTMCGMARNTIAWYIRVEIAATRNDWVGSMLPRVSEDGKAMCRIIRIATETLQAYIGRRKVRPKDFVQQQMSVLNK